MAATTQKVKRENFVFPSNLIIFQLGQAIDCYLLSKQFATTARPGIRKPREIRFAMSCVIHAYAALEGTTAKIKFERFKNKTSLRHKPRVTAVEKKFLDDWDQRRVKLEDQLSWLGKQVNRTLSPDVVSDVAELRDLRNLLAHGYVTRGLAIFETAADGVTRLIADKTQHAKKFPRLKIKAPDKLAYHDAGAALRVAIQAVHETLELFMDSELVAIYEAPEQPPFTLGFGSDPRLLLSLIV